MLLNSLRNWVKGSDAGGTPRKASTGTLVAAGASILVGILVVLRPAISFGIVLALLIGLLGIHIGNQRLWTNLLAVFLVGHAFLGRNFAGIGLGPIYITDVFLGYSLVALLIHSFSGTIRKPHAPIYFLFLFLIWNAGVALANLQQYGLETARDSVAWAYGLFAIVIYSMLDRRHLTRLIGGYPWFMIAMLVWVVVDPIKNSIIPVALQQLPGSDLSVLRIRPGDLGAHLGGIAAFLALDMRSLPQKQGWRPKGFYLWVAWFMAAMIVMAQNRGGGLAAAVGLTSALALRRKGHGLIKPVFAGAFLVVLLVLAGFSLEPAQQRIEGVFIADTGTSLDNTRDWRLRWWGDIFDYTLNGEHFFGKGYGINIADSDGYQVHSGNDNPPLRSPHNVSMTFLARAGVIGFGLWILFLLATFRVGVTERKLQSLSSVRSLWLLAYALSLFTTATFDVFIEGPSGALWFWGVAGLLLVSVHVKDAPASPWRAPTDGEMKRDS
jgi:hypothetical protein